MSLVSWLQSCNAPEDISTETKNLKVEQFVVSKRIGLPTGISNLEFKERMVDGLIYDLKAYVLSEDIEEKTEILEVKYPKNAWNFVKYECFPDWLLHYFPVEYTIERKKSIFKAKAFYPNASFTPKLGEPVVKVTVMNY